MTTPKQYDRLYRLFESACELELDQRSALLDRECADDPTVRREVEALLARDSDPSSFLESSLLREDFGLADIDQRDPGAAARVCGHRIDNYLIREILGEGGIAVVYLAEQEKPVCRRVALKVIKPGMDSRQVIARFEAERQALAMMDHVCVAKVFDAGSTEAGRPYFVMEHVPGIAITEHCDRQRLSIEDRLRLFMQVCEGVQHAHQKGIIHRDLKPSNVLVRVKDGQAVPKVIDFGVAKALHQILTERTIFTEQGQLIGTPAYMSPEQAEMTAQDIDTRSDIYALGVLLYELLTGALPFDPKTLRQAAFGEIQRIIREEEPPKPSTRLSSNGDESKIYAQMCGADPRSLIRELRGDLDWIVMKALEKDRTRRYETADGLAKDIRRHLDHEPVHAGPPSRAYRLRKFVRRHRAGVAAGSVVAISLIVAAVVSASFAFSEAEQRRVASTERDIAQAVNEFLNEDLLAAVAPSAEAGRGKDVLMRDVLDEAAKRIEEASGMGGRFEDKLLVEASIRTTLGATYKALGEYSTAAAHLERARELRDSVLGEEHPGTLQSMGDLAALYNLLGRYDEAEPLLLQTLEVQKRVLTEEHPDTLTSMSNLAHVYDRQGREDEAALLYLETLRIRKRVLGAEHPDTLESMGKVANTESLHLEWLETSERVLGEEHPDTLLAMHSLADLYRLQNRHDESESLYLELLEISKRLLGEEHPDTLHFMHYLSITYGCQGRLDEAELLLLEAVEIMQRVLGEEHPETLRSMGSLAGLYAFQGRYDEAEPLALRTLEPLRRVLGEGRYKTLKVQDTLGFVLLKTGRVEEAEVLFSDIASIVERVRGEDRHLAAIARAHHAMCLVELGQFEEAELLLLEAYPLVVRPEESERPWFRGYSARETVRYLIKIYDAWNMPDKAAEWRAKLPTEQGTWCP